MCPLNLLNHFPMCPLNSSMSQLHQGLIGSLPNNMCYLHHKQQCTVFGTLWSLLRAEKYIYVVNTCNCADIVYKEYNKITGSVIKVVYLHSWNRSKPLLIIHGDQREKKAQLHKEAEPFSNVKLFQVQLYLPLEQAMSMYPRMRYRELQNQTLCKDHRRIFYN